MKNFPMQPIIRAKDGVVRFQSNRIIEDLFNAGKIDLNEIAIFSARGAYTDAEQMQLAQLIGYSVSGFGDLSYADRDVLRRADRKAKMLSKKEPGTA